MTEEKAPINPIYYIGLFLVAFITFIFVGYVLPSLSPVIGITFFSGMLVLIVIGWSLRVWRIHKLPQKIKLQNEAKTELTTQDYIKEVERLMGKK